MLALDASMLSFQDSTTIGVRIEGESGTWHSVADVYGFLNRPVPLIPQRAEWTFSIRPSITRRKFWPIPRRESDEKIVRRNSPVTFRQCVLHYLANGGAFRGSEIKRLVFGSSIRTGTSSDVNPVFWKQHHDKGEFFDRFVRETAPEILGFESSEATGWEELESQREIEDILSSIPTSKDARQMLAEEYRKYGQQQNC